MSEKDAEIKRLRDVVADTIELVSDLLLEAPEGQLGAAHEKLDDILSDLKHSKRKSELTDWGLKED